MPTRDMSQADPKLQVFFQFAKKGFEMEFPKYTLRPTCVYRSLSEQAQALAEGKSQLSKGKHNVIPTQAFDFGIFRKGDGAWIDDVKGFDSDLRKALYGWVGELAELHGFRSGFDWNGNGIPVDVDPDEHLNDPYHVEIHQPEVVHG